MASVLRSLIVFVAIVLTFMYADEAAEWIIDQLFPESDGSGPLYSILGIITTLAILYIVQTYSEKGVKGFFNALNTEEKSEAQKSIDRILQEQRLLRHAQKRPS